eukprot:jgi/Astpho2/2553/fgenesh1_pg.00048_%23_56_t
MDMPTQDYGTSGELSFQNVSLAGAPESSPGADPHHQDAQQQAAQQQQIPGYSSVFVREMQQQVNALLGNEVLTMTREIDSNIQATANCLVQARHDSIKLFQETMAQLDQLADMVRDFQVSEEHVSALPVQGKLKHSRKLPLDQPPFPPSPPAKQPSRCLLYAQAPW